MLKDNMTYKESIIDGLNKLDLTDPEFDSMNSLTKQEILKLQTTDWTNKKEFIYWTNDIDTFIGEFKYNCVNDAKEEAQSFIQAYQEEFEGENFTDHYWQIDNNYVENVLSIDPENSILLGKPFDSDALLTFLKISGTKFNVMTIVGGRYYDSVAEGMIVDDGKIAISYQDPDDY
jgi:hypothetical protein